MKILLTRDSLSLDPHNTIITIRQRKILAASIAVYIYLETVGFGGLV
jgi:hypothetical protein